MKQLELTIIKKPWGTTTQKLLSEVQLIMYHFNTPLPEWMGEQDKVNMANLAETVRQDCERVSKSVRVGMMISTNFRVEHIGDEITIWAKGNVNSDKMFLKIIKVKPQPIEEI